MTPIGRIINRLSRDVFLIDEILIMQYPDMVQFIFFTIGFLGTLVFTNLYLIFVVIIFVIGIYLLVKFSLATSRELKKIELVTRSPLFSHLNNSLTGLKVIRAYNNQNHFKGKFLDDALLN